MSVFNALPQTLSGAVPPGSFGSVFSTPADPTPPPPPPPQQQQQQHQQQHQSQPPGFPSHSPVLASRNTATVFRSSRSNAPGGPPPYPRNASPPVFFGASSTPTVKLPAEGVPAAVAGLPTGHTTSAFNAPVFGTAAAFTSAAPLSMATVPFSSGGAVAPSNNNAVKAAVSSAFAPSVFQRASHSSTAPASAVPTPTDPRSSAFGAPKGKSTWDGTTATTTAAAVFSSPKERFSPSPSVFPAQAQSTPPFNPMAAGAKRGRGGAVVGGRGSGRGDAQPSSAHGVRESRPTPQAQLPASTTSFSPARGGKTQQNRAPQQKQQQSAVVDAKNQLLATRVFTSFMCKIMSEKEAQREEAAELLESAFFGVVGSHGSGEFATVLQQMLGAWLALKGQQQTTVKGEYWVALFAIGCHLNLVSSIISAGEADRHSTSGAQRAIVLDNKWSVLADSCTYANLLCDICLQLFSNQSENHAPYGVLPLTLRRARETFELANDEGISSVLPNVKTVLLKLNRHVRMPALQHAPHSEVERQRAAAFACVLGEMMLHCCAPANCEQFIQSFHEHCSDMVGIRCTLYHHYAHNLLVESLSDAVIYQAMKLLAHAFVIVPDDAIENRRLLFVKLTACGLALGKMPSPAEQEAYNVTELEDLILAVRSCNLHLFNVAHRNNSEWYVRCGIHNVLQVVGKRIALLMVVKYYISHPSNRLSVQDMIDYYHMPLSLQEACHVWLLPLLVEKRINGVMESGVLVLSGANPFDDYSKEALTAFGATENDE
ncbi:hypothetical protein DQ04_03621070 [Trypanosoma grayi]|uniref:hypothetical protein n=1 Tax=Trypanosoma grayi TaxID=71804 RepID=UPI0004F442E3|nr:hypothetical protein DQ04_03621070 [Trypanosoma grayi]KEG10522.1 hypothetical protein DQ04_03621070 [Trypanosoma grayi]